MGFCASLGKPINNCSSWWTVIRSCVSCSSRLLLYCLACLPSQFPMQQKRFACDSNLWWERTSSPFGSEIESEVHVVCRRGKESPVVCSCESAPRNCAQKLWSSKECLRSGREKWRWYKNTERGSCEHLSSRKFRRLEVALRIQFFSKNFRLPFRKWGGFKFY